MNERELKLIIKTEIARAEAEVKKFVSEVLKAKTGTASLQKELDAARSRFELLGDKTAFLSQKQAALTREMERLIDEGIKPQAAELQKLADDYRANAKELDNAKDKTKDFGQVVKDAMSVGAMVQGTKKIGEFARATVEGFAEAEAASMRLDAALQIRGMQETRPALDALAASIQRLTGADDDLVTQKEAELIAQGKSLQMTQNLIEAAAAYASISGDDLSTAIDMVSGSLGGMAREMGKNIPEIKDLSEEQLKNGAAVELLLGKYGTFTKTMSDSTRVQLNRMTEDMANASDTIGQAFVPVMQLGVDVLTSLAAVVRDLPEPVRQGVVVVLVAAAGAMAGMTIKTVLQTAATWGLFGAQMAANGALAVANPLLWAGIAAATAGAIAIAAMASAKAKEAQATDQGADAERGAAQAHMDRYDAMKQAADQIENYKKSLDDLTLSEAIAERTRLAKERNSLNGRIVTPQVTSNLDVLTKEIAELDPLIEKLQKKAADVAKDAANKIQDDALKAFETIIEGSKTEVERLESQIKALGGVKFIMPENQAKQAQALEELQKKLAAAQAQANVQRQVDEAKFTATKLDDIEAERVQELLTVALKEKDLTALATKQAAIMKKFDDQVRQARAEESTKEAAAAAKLTETRIDDLQVEYDQALILAEGNEATIAALREKFEKDLSKTKADEAMKLVQEEAAARKQAFEAQRALAQKGGDLAGIAGSVASEALAGTDIGKLAGAGGSMAVDPMTMIFEEAAKMLLSMKSVSQVVNFVGTIFEGAKSFLEPVFDQILAPLIEWLTTLGEVIGKVLTPVINAVLIPFNILYKILNVTLMPVLQAVGDAFAWLNDYVIVPFGNAIIWVVNAVIDAINWALGWAGVHLNRLDNLKTTKELAAIEQERIRKEEIINEQLDKLKGDFNDRRRDLDDAYDKNVSSLKRLLEVGAIDSAKYSTDVQALNDQRKADLEALAGEEELQTKYLEGILKELQNGGNPNLPSFDVGTTRVPRDMLAKIHKDETIIPADFSAGLRRGDLTLGRGASKAGTTIIIPVTVEGSLYSETGLVDSLARKVNTRVGRGLLELGNVS